MGVLKISLKYVLTVAEQCSNFMSAATVGYLSEFDTSSITDIIGIRNVDPI